MQSSSLFAALLLTALTYVSSHVHVDPSCIPKAVTKWIDEAFPDDSFLGRLHSLTATGHGHSIEFETLRPMKPKEIELVLKHPEYPQLTADMDCKVIKPYYKALPKLPKETQDFLYDMPESHRATFIELVNTTTFTTLLESMHHNKTTSKSQILLETLYTASQCPAVPATNETSVEESGASGVRITAVSGAVVLLGTALLL